MRLGRGRVRDKLFGGTGLVLRPFCRLARAALRLYTPIGRLAFPGVHSAAMRSDLITIFPEVFVGPMEHGIVRKAREAGLVDVRVQDLREFTKDRHRTVDD